MYDFDDPKPLLGRHTSKRDGVKAIFGFDAPDLIPMWVADMDFAAAPAILDALRDEVDYGSMSQPCRSAYHRATAAFTSCGWLK